MEEDKQRKEAVEATYRKWYGQVHENPVGLLEFDKDQIREAFGEAFDKGRLVQGEEDIFAWAEGVQSAVHNEDLAHKVDDKEALLAAFVLAMKKEMPELLEELKEEYPEHSHEMIFEDLEEL